VAGRENSGTIAQLKDEATCPQLKFYIVTNLIVHRDLAAESGTNPDSTFPAHMTGFTEGLLLAARHPELAMKMLDDYLRVSHHEDHGEWETEMDDIARATVTDWVAAAGDGGTF
jgi:hypothetical protein